MGERMLHCYHSNRLEVLAEALAMVTDQPLSDPFGAEILVVQNQGMARWINQQVAERIGVSARLDYPLPAVFFWRLLQTWLPDAPEPELFDREALLWRILRQLPRHLGDDAFAPLGRYLAGEGSDLRLFQLARRVADLFDQYLVQRPEMVLGWEAGTDEQWQARLWRALGAESGQVHRARLMADLAAAMRQGPPTAGGLPERVCLFGLTALAPVYTDLLGLLAQHLPVHCFYLNPCREYWSDLVDERGQARRRARASRAGQPDPTGLLDLGNPLLASLGHAGQVFLDQLLELGGEDHDLFEPPQADSLLHRVQLDVLDLMDARKDPQPPAPVDDTSIQLHSVHGPLREIQVLHDRLLRCFEDLPGLEPRDIVVMAPDIDLYAPYVDAVFAAAPPEQRIPWSIADRRLGVEQPVLEALRQFLLLPRSRLEASSVLSLLEVPAVSRRFGLEDAGLERIRTWVMESGVRWGEDAEMGPTLELPPARANTWRFGLDRLLLGYALPPDPDLNPFAGILPYIDLEGGEVAWLGALADFIKTLGGWRRRLTQARSPQDWREAVNALIADLLAPDQDEEPVLQLVRERLDALVSLAGRTGFSGTLSLEVMRALLESVLEDSRGAQRFLTGRVTFCNMVPMRSIPFRVVCLIGMNGEAFPRSQRPQSFDLMARTPRRGDRFRRRDDRYLFLEAMLSARDLLYLSWVGRDQRDDSIKVPSVVVSELIDYLKQGHGWSDRHLIQHPLQPFGRAYFDGADPRLFSYSRIWAEAARSGRGATIPAFAATPLGPPDESLRLCSIDDLVRFLSNPARYFLTRRLGLRLPDETESPQDVEPFDAAGLERWDLRQRLLRQRLAGLDQDQMLGRLRGEGLLPHGSPGELLLEEQLGVVDPFCRRLTAFEVEEPVEPLEVDLDLEGFRLQGRLTGLREGGLLDSRLGKLRCKDRLGIWVRHLALNAQAPTGMALSSRYLAEDATLHMNSLADAEEARKHLADLLALRWQGLCAPLAFFPESALAWLKKQEYDDGFHKAWDAEYGPASESSDLAVTIAFRGRDPLGDAFEANARRILGPMECPMEIAKHSEEGP